MESCIVIGGGNEIGSSLSLLLLNKGWTVYYLDEFKEVEIGDFLDCFKSREFIFIDFSMLEKEINFRQYADVMVNLGPVTYDNAKDYAKREVFAKPGELADDIYKRLME